MYFAYSGSDIEVWCVIQPPNSLDGMGDINRFKGEIEDIDKEIDEADRGLAEMRTLTSSVDWSTQNDLINEQSDIRAAQLENNMKALHDTKSSIANQLELTINNVNSNGSRYVKLAECSSISGSIFRDKKLVRGIGQTNIKGVTRAGRTIAGSLIFSLFDKAIMHELLESISPNGDARFVLVDQLPPVDIFVFYGNEYGNVSSLGIYGVEFMNEGHVISINDMYLEQTVNYVARDIDTMASISKRQDYISRYGISVDAMIAERYKDVKTRLRAMRNSYL